MSGTIATNLGYCREMAQWYREIADGYACGPTKRHAMLRVYQYKHRIALLEAGTPRDQLRNLAGDCPITLADLDADGNLRRD